MIKVRQTVNVIDASNVNVLLIRSMLSVERNVIRSTEVNQRYASRSIRLPQNHEVTHGI
tara:strand:+ start:146 stop:322 length:177 start_codon:yes stop_codon:yes gene_type:complete